MKQAIAGVTPAESEEVTQMEVWPSICATSLGRALGRGYAIVWPDLYVLRLGNLIALATIPLALVLYFYRLKPCIFGIPLHGVWYRLTNRRVLVLQNEIRLGQALAGLRIALGCITMVAFAAIFAILFFTVYNGQFPSSLLAWVPLAVCAVGVLAGGAPLLFPDVPFPRFHYAVESKSVGLDRFDEIAIDVRPGQEWFAAGDLIFRRDGVETFRLDAVSRPQAFRQVLMKARNSYVGVQQALLQQAVPA